jgi:hypothetical protein
MSDSSAVSALFRTAARGQPADAEPGNDELLPSVTDGNYQPYARPTSKPVYAIHFMKPKGEIFSFQYIHLDSNSHFSAECITLRFIGFDPVTVRLRGRNLWRLYDYLHQHRMPWIAEASTDFAADGQPVITKVEIEKLEPGK